VPDVVFAYTERTVPRSSKASILVALSAIALALAGGCSKPPTPNGNTPPAASVERPDAQTAHVVSDAQVVVAPVDAGLADAHEAVVAETPPPGADFTPQAMALFRTAACGGDHAPPPGIPSTLTDAHCKELAASYAEYKHTWVDVAGPFLAKLRPAGLPETIVYPFGGGDLVTALATFPDAREITTISLEPAADPRGIDGVKTPQLTRSLRDIRAHLGKLFLKAHSRTDNLDLESKSALPGEIVFSMAALVVHGFEPVSLRYFRFEDDGKIRYVTDDDLKAAGDKKAQKSLFQNAELRFKKPGEARSRVLRHVGYDLSDGNLKLRPQIMKHLEAKGKVSAMTKAASHLLWDDGFSIIREYLLTHMEWMISDTTGIPPRRIKGRGFVHEVYGQYEWPEPFGSVNNRDATDFKELFKGKDPISFRYGYPDNHSHGHIVVTKKGP
jgi:hypothetical protein